ncbi:hypothetical protein CL689_02520 [Candidatus Saccharibacteria bacterium]|nr:hypothetical protein [Candidatus Saccharibacteria bacterium]|tara:strand:+ start:1134 stop:1622 length:489 start_codon:yes stop_codon:yes gene_type:complete
MTEYDPYIDIRRKNMNRLLQERFEGRQQSMATAMNVSQQSISSWVKEGPKARPIGDRAARKIEKTLGLDRYALDKGGIFTIEHNQKDTNSQAVGPGDVLELDCGRWLLCTDSGQRFLMAVDLDTHPVGKIKRSQDLDEIEEKFSYSQVSGFRKIGQIKFDPK